MSLAAEIAALQRLPVAELVARYVAQFGKQPRRRQAGYLVRHIAFAVQEAALGGLSRRAQQRLGELQQQIELPAPPRSRSADLRPGATLTRRWHDRDYQVEVTDHGFVFDGSTYRSLSAVAAAITGTKWNGRLFFNLPKGSS